MGDKKTGIIIVAGGKGNRVGGTLPKQFRILGQLPVLAHTLQAFAQALPGAPIVVVLPAEQIDFWKDLSARFNTPAHTCTVGGSERFFSVQRGLAALPETVDLIAVHDGVRPLVTEEMILRTVDCAAHYGSAIPVVEVADSLRRITLEGSTPENRTPLRIVQTPQVFDAKMLRDAYQTEFCPDFTDDASVFERAGLSVTLCPGERSNLKITTPDDLLTAQGILLCREMAREEDL